MKMRMLVNLMMVLIIAFDLLEFFCIFGVKILLSFGKFSFLTTVKKLVVFRTAVKEGGAGGRKAAISSNLSPNNSACRRKSPSLLFFKHFSLLQLVATV